MSLFEEIKRSASDVANKAVKKTGELTTIAKLGINVKSNEAKLSSVFEEIGFMFYEAQCTGDDHTSDIASLIMKADKIKADIENTKKEIAKLKKVVVCQNCGNEISEEAAYCSFCGAKVEKVEPETCSCEEESCECSCCCGESEETDSCECECDCCCSSDEAECNDECTCEQSADDAETDSTSNE